MADHILWMRILHFSDLHGTNMAEAEALIDSLAPDWIVLTGDMLPDFARLPGESRRLQGQRDWWAGWRRAFLKEGVRTTFVRGNHELTGFLDPELRWLPPALAGKVAFVEGIPARWGAWGYARELSDEDLALEVRSLGDPRVVLSHVPPYGWLDRNRRGDHIGHIPLRECLDPPEEVLERGGPRLLAPLPAPALVLCGHVHEAFGQERHGPTLVVNAATGYALVELDPQLRSARVLRMERLLQGRPDPYA